MTPIAKSEAFFFISSVAVIVLSLLTAAIFLYVLRILRDVRAIVERTKAEVERVSDDFARMRAEWRNAGTSRGLWWLVQQFFRRRRKVEKS